MATKQSTLLSNVGTQTAAGTPNNVANEGGKVRSVSGNVALVVGDLDAADIIMLAPVPTGAAVLSILIANDDLDAVTDVTFNVGIYRNADDTAENGDENVYATLSTQLRAAAGFTELAFEARNLNLAGQKVFADAGDSTDPDSTYFIGVGIVTTPATAQAGDLAFMIEYAID